MLQGKRGRPARAKCAKTKTWRKPGFVYSDNYNISSSESESESEGNNDDDYDPTVRSYMNSMQFRQ